MNEHSIIALEEFLNSSHFETWDFGGPLDQRLLKIKEEWQTCILLVEQMFLEAVLSGDWTELENFIASCKQEGRENDFRQAI